VERVVLEEGSARKARKGGEFVKNEKINIRGVICKSGKNQQEMDP